MGPDICTSMALPVMLRLLPWTLLMACTPDADPRQVGGGGPGGTTVPTGPVTTTVTTTHRNCSIKLAISSNSKSCIRSTCTNFNWISLT